MIKAGSIPIFVLRLLAFGATVSAIIVTVTSHDSTQVLNISFKPSYTNAPTLKYFVVANAIASVYSLIVLFLPFKNLIWRFILVLDLVITALLISSISAALGVAQVGKKGNAHAGWLPICNQVPKFCDHVTGALIVGFIAPIIYFLLVLYSLHNVLWRGRHVEQNTIGWCCVVAFMFPGRTWRRLNQGFDSLFASQVESQSKFKIVFSSV